MSRVERFATWVKRRPALAASRAVACAAAIGLAALAGWGMTERLHRIHLVGLKEEELKEKQAQIKSTEMEIDKRGDAIRAQAMALRKSDWALRLEKAKLHRLSHSRSKSLTELQQLADEHNASPEVGDTTLLREELLLAVNRPGVRVVRTIELPHRLAMAPQFAPNGAAIVGVIEDEESNCMVYGLPWPAGMRVHQGPPSTRPNGDSEAVWFTGDGASVKVKNTKGWSLWDPVTNQDVGRFHLEGEAFAQMKVDRGHHLGRYDILQSPCKTWEAIGRQLWKTRNKAEITLLPHQARAFLSDHIVLLSTKDEGVTSTIAWDLESKKAVLEMRGDLISTLTEDLVLVGTRRFALDTGSVVETPYALWSLKDRKIKYELPQHLMNLPGLGASIGGSIAGPLTPGPLVSASTVAAGTIRRKGLAHTPDWSQAALHNLQANTSEIWNLKEGRLLAALPAVAYGYRDHMFSTDGRRFVFTPQERPTQIHIWERDNGMVRPLAGSSSPHRFGSLSPNGRLLAAFPMGARFMPGSSSAIQRRPRPWFEGEKLSLWDLETMQLLETVELPFVLRGSSWTSFSVPYAIPWSSDSRYFIIRPQIVPGDAGVKHAFHVFEVTLPVAQFLVRESVKNIPYSTFGDRLTTLRFSPDGKKLAVNGKVWTVEQGKDYLTLLRPERDSSADLVYFGNDGQTWNVSLPWRNPEDLADDPIRIKLDGSQSETLTIPWPKDLLSRQAPRYYPRVWVYALGISPSGNQIVVLFGRAANRDGTGSCAQLQVWNRKGAAFELSWNLGSVNRPMSVVSDPVTSQQERRDLGAIKAVGGELLEYPLPIDQRVVFMPDEQRFLLIGTSQASGFDIPSKSFIREGIMDRSFTPVFSHDWHICVYGSKLYNDMFVEEEGGKALRYRQVARLAEATLVEQGRRLGTIPPTPFEGPFAALSANKKYAAIACNDGIVRLYDVATARQLWQCRPHTHEVTAMAFSPDGNTLVTAGQEGMLKVWHLEQIRHDLNGFGMGW